MNNVGFIQYTPRDLKCLLSDIITNRKKYESFPYAIRKTYSHQHTITVNY